LGPDLIACVRVFSDGATSNGSHFSTGRSYFPFRFVKMHFYEDANNTREDLIMEDNRDIPLGLVIFSPYRNSRFHGGDFRHPSIIFQNQ
jgi:hypothetical protein